MCQKSLIFYVHRVVGNFVQHPDKSVLRHPFRVLNFSVNFIYSVNTENAPSSPPGYLSAWRYMQGCESRRQTISSSSRPRFREIWKVSSLSGSLPLSEKKVSPRSRPRFGFSRPPPPRRERELDRCSLFETPPPPPPAHFYIIADPVQ